MSPTTVFDIDGVEYYVINTKYSKKFNIELYYGRLEEKGRSKPSLILTKELKTIILENEILRAKDFGEFLSPTTINKLRRRVKENPYKSYIEWVESTDPDKPKEIRFLNTRDQPEIVTDYFGTKHILFSARIANNGIVLPIGIPIDQYKYYHKYGKNYIVTQALAEFIKKYRYHPVWASEELSITLQSSKHIRQILGYDKNPDEEVNMWLAAHLAEITSMSKEKFISEYMRNVEMGRGSVIRNLKNGLHLLQVFSKSAEKDKRTIFRIVRTLDTNASTEVIKKLHTYLYRETARRCVKAYKVLMLAEAYNHDIPHGYKGILKKKKLQ